MKYGTMSYILNNGSVLLVEKVERIDDPNSGFYTMPGGKLNSFEMSSLNGRLESVIRETMEETGINIINPKLRGVILFDNKDRTFPNWPNPDNFFVYIFTSNSFFGNLRESEEGKPKWISMNSLNNLPMNPGDRKVYEWLQDGRYFIGVIRHKGYSLDEENTFVDFFN